MNLRKRSSATGLPTNLTSHDGARSIIDKNSLQVGSLISLRFVIDVTQGPPFYRVTSSLRWGDDQSQYRDHHHLNIFWSSAALI